MWKILFARGTKLKIVESTLRQTQIFIRTAENLICVFIVLTVVFPEANGAYVVVAALGECFVATAWAAQWKVSNLHFEA